MNPYLASLLLGIIEGLTEFLPVSSTAHLELAMSQMLGKDANTPFWNMYVIVIQLGAILALPVFFWPRIRKFIRSFPRGERGSRNVLNHPLSLVMIAFVVTALPMYFLKKVSSENLHNFHAIAWALLIGGIIMWA